jgi:ABC-type branched-subunit amino acid transport system substrate-binding protein
VRRPALLLLTVVLAGCGGSGSKSSGGTLLIAVNAPFSREPALGNTIARGAELAVSQVNPSGGLVVGSRRYRLKVKRYDNALSPQRAVQNVRQAVADGAIAIVDEGTGVDASWQIARDANVPICITYQGGEGLVDPATRPNVFRIAPTDHGVAFRLAEYLIPKGLKIALLHDDSDYGEQGAAALAQAFSRNPGSVAARLTLPSTANDLSPQVLRARRVHATALLVWGRGPTIAKVLLAARAAGWDVPVYTPPSGEDPIVRQQLADHPSWVDGLTFASGRMTAERGPASFLNFQNLYRSAYGPGRIGVKTASGKPVVQPPDYAMYSYDFVHVLEAALAAAKSPDRRKVLAQLNEVVVEGANGDERGFNVKSHEGVVDDDVYFARLRDMTFRPIKDDPLSSTLPVIDQTG